MEIREKEDERFEWAASPGRRPARVALLERLAGGVTTGYGTDQADAAPVDEVA